MSDVMNKSLSQVWSELGCSEWGVMEVQKGRKWAERMNAADLWRFAIISTAVLNICDQKNVAVNVTASLTSSY